MFAALPMLKREALQAKLTPMAMNSTPEKKSF
jgi:hypothetical protein